MIEYYEYETETSPRKLEPEYNPEPKKRATETSSKKNPNYDSNKRTNKSSNKNAEHRKNIKHIVEIGTGFIVLLTISYRYALINSSFSEKEKMKTQLLALQKQNDQLQVNIEQQMNINNIEQAAKEKLGMQKLDNNQRIYISLNKQDYIESSKDTVIKNETESWWTKLINAIKGN